MAAKRRTAGGGPTETVCASRTSPAAYPTKTLVRHGLCFKSRSGHDVRFQGRESARNEVIERLVEKRQVWHENDDCISRPSEENPVGIESQLECVTNELLAEVPR